MRLFDKRYAGGLVEEAAEIITQPGKKGQFVKRKRQKTDHFKASSTDGQVSVSLNPRCTTIEIIAEFSRCGTTMNLELQTLEAHFADASSKAERTTTDNEIRQARHGQNFSITGRDRRRFRLR